MTPSVILSKSYFLQEEQEGAILSRRNFVMSHQALARNSPLVGKLFISTVPPFLENRFEIFSFSRFWPTHFLDFHKKLFLRGILTDFHLLTGKKFQCFLSFLFFRAKMNGLQK